MFVQLNNQRIFFDVAGTQLELEGPLMRDKLSLLVLHGGPGFDHSGFRPSFDQFSDIAQVIYIDHRGNGRSTPSNPDTWTLDQWGDDIFEFCQALGIEKPVVMGQSFGGMVAQSYMTRHPDHPRAVILSSTAARMDFEASFKIFEKKGGSAALAVAERFWRDGDDAVFAEYMRICMPLYNTTVHPDGQNSRLRAITRTEVYRHFSLPGREIRRMDFRIALRHVMCPVMVLSGVEDPITPPHLADEILTSLPVGLVEGHCYERCGHGAFRDDPDRVFADIRQFLKKVS
ncbi:MAG: alpha/beta fold hydrolase [Micropepsaceae bacterium]